MTVGTVYMSIPDAPIKEIMKDMMEMTRGVQHPTRGLFLRHYLSGMTRDHLPIGDDPGCVSARARLRPHSSEPPAQALWKPTGLDRVRPDELHRDEQALGAPPALGPFARPRAKGDGAPRAAHPRRHEPRTLEPARRRRPRDVPPHDPAERARAGRQLQGCHRAGVPHGGRHPGAFLAFRKLGEFRNADL